MERRHRGTGQVTQVPCRWCATPVPIEAATMVWHDTRPFQVCPGCETEVPVRYSDGFRASAARPVPADNIRPIFG